MGKFFSNEQKIILRGLLDKNPFLNQRPLSTAQFSSLWRPFLARWIYCDENQFIGSMVFRPAKGLLNWYNIYDRYPLMLKVTRLTMTRSRKAMIYTCIFSLTAVRSSCLHFIRFIIEVVIIFIHIPSCLYEIALKLLINIWPSFSKSFCSLSSSCLQHFDYIVHKDSRHLRKMSTSGQ